MEPERLHRLTELFRAALEHEPDQRAPFLGEVCADDASLRAEVGALLVYHEHASGLLAESTHLVSPPTQPVAAVSSVVSLVGRQLSHYAIARQIGAGGMGVVYLANDTQLGRQVAMKMLAPAFTQDSRYRERLRQEARSVAAFTHPGIATVYALEEFDHSLCLVSEYVQGHTLRDEVVRGPLELRVLIDTAVQIARALATAHDHGVVHRDLKPENVVRREDGVVKILDFGLARVDRPGSGSGPRLTDYGTILGTPGYMPPEQLRGLDVDFRADIFAFGVLLYELASGVHPFAGGGVTSTIARVLEVDPPNVVRLNPGCPDELDSIISLCLRKDPALRFRSTRELVECLEGLRRDLTPPDARGSHASIVRGRRVQIRFPSTSLGWWQFHQAVVATFYCAMLIPLWLVRSWTPDPWGSVAFFGGVGAVAVSATLRFHLWFVSHFRWTDLEPQRKETFPWIRAADWSFVLLLVLGGVLVAPLHASVTTVLFASAVGSFLAFHKIEPTTMRAAFAPRSSTPGADL